MKKSNWIVLAICVLVSAFLLWLWYYLNFNRIDNPFDLVLSILWWAIIVIAAVMIWRIERRRQERIRTIYVGDRFWFNSELGKSGYLGSDELISGMERTLAKLKYNFHKEDLPDAEKLPIRYLVRTEKYKGDADDEEKNEWVGVVCVAGEESEYPFETREGLAQIMHRLSAVA